MNGAFPVAVITYKEGIRNRAIYGIAILALTLVAVNILVSGMIPQDVGKVSVDFGLASISFSGLLLVLFVGINLMAKDLDRRTIYMVLARPISRGQYILGKFLGLCLLLVSAVGCLSLFSLASIFLLKQLHPDYFVRFSPGSIALAIVFILLMLILLAAVSILFASFTTTSFVTFILTILTYIVGHGIGAVRELMCSADVIGIEISPMTKKIVDLAYYIFPNLSLFDIKTQAAHALSIPMAHVAWVFLYFAIYTSLSVFLAALIFARREFP